MAQRAEPLTVGDLLELSPGDFERTVGRVFESMGYEVTVTGRTGDQGVDLRLEREGDLAIAQCKRYSGTVGQPAVRDFFGTMQHAKAARGFLVTTGVFSLAASTWAQGKAIALVDGPDLVAAVANAAIDVAPTMLAASPSPTKSLLELVRVAQADNGRFGRILVDGAPPSGCDYTELAQYLGGNLALMPSILEGSELRKFDAWEAREKMEPGLLFVNELDASSRTDMEAVIRLQRILGDSTVLIATRWDIRIPKRILAQFSTVIPTGDVEWESVADRKNWEKKWKAAAAEAGRRRKEREAEAKRRRKEAKAQVDQLLKKRAAAADRKRREAVTKERKRQLAHEEAALSREEVARKRDVVAMAGLYCDVCKKWFAEGYENWERLGKCSVCQRFLRFDGNRKVHQTGHSGIFGLRWHTSDPAAVARGKQTYIQKTFG
jgi:restriction endonuclease Mrr